MIRDVGPADVDVVAGIGDFLVAGTSALANDTAETFKDYQQVSFATGGSGDWRSVTSITNLLREFNPGVVGYSVGKNIQKLI